MKVFDDHGDVSMRQAYLPGVVTSEPSMGLLANIEPRCMIEKTIEEREG
jgi:hypothetical protein